MKKIALLIVATLAIIVMSMSCQGNKKCPAYDSLNNSINYNTSLITE